MLVPQCFSAFFSFARDNESEFPIIFPISSAETGSNWTASATNKINRLSRRRTATPRPRNDPSFAVNEPKRYRRIS